MTDKAILVLEDGTSFVGKPLGAAGRPGGQATHGEVVFVGISRPRVETRGMDGSAW